MTLVECDVGNHANQHSDSKHDPQSGVELALPTLKFVDHALQILIAFCFFLLFREFEIAVVAFPDGEREGRDQVVKDDDFEPVHDTGSEDEPSLFNESIFRQQ